MGSWGCGREMPRTVAGARELDDASALQDAIEDGISEVRVVQDLAPHVGPLVRSEDHGAMLEVPVVDDLEEDVGGVGRMAEVTNYSPSLADKLARSTATHTIEEIAAEIFAVVRGMDATG